MHVSIQSIQLDAPFDTNGSIVVLAELIWPRPAIASRSGLKTVRLRKGKYRFPLKPYYARMLLKEKVDGRFGLVVRVTRPTRNPAALGVLSELLARAVEASGASLSNLLNLPTSALRSVVEAPFDAMADQLEDDSLQFIAEGGFDFDSESEFSGSHTFELKLSQALTLPDPAPTNPRARETRRPRPIRLKQGTKVGEVVLSLAD